MPRRGRRRVAEPTNPGGGLCLRATPPTSAAMLSDRPYMRGDYPRERTSVLTWLIAAVIAGFVVQNVAEKWLGLTAFGQALAFSSSALRHGWVWTLFTHAFLHRDVLHVLMLLLSLYFIGRELVPLVGEERFAGIFFGATALGALAWFATNPSRAGDLVGIGAATLALFIVFACFHPNREISFLVFFVLPVTLKPKWLAWILIGLELAGFLFGELLGGRFDSGLPHSAHLGGIAAGWIYFRYLHDARWPGAARGADLKLPRWMKKSAPTATPTSTPQVDLTHRGDLRIEVDRILDKINSQGFGALTAAEKRVLDEAKDLLSRR